MRIIMTSLGELNESELLNSKIKQSSNAAYGPRQLPCRLGSSIYDVHEKIEVFDPLLCPHEPDPSPPCGRPHAFNMKYTSLS